jgi:DNA-directed RNA polymerase subunit RPC12/RpoP
MGEILDAFLTAFDADNTKRCAKCWRYLPLTDFGHDGRTRDHLTYRCNECRAIVPNQPDSGTETAETAANRNDHTDRKPSGRFIANPHFHGDH